MTDDDSSSSSSSSSDDEFLTISNKTTTTGAAAADISTTAPTPDREALVRKKLLENFYGKSAVKAVTAERDIATAAAGIAANHDDDDDHPEDEEARGGAAAAAISKNAKTTSVVTAATSDDDLDSIQFNAYRYASNRIQNNSVHELLDVEEQLALNVRTLDSTMQTLVYENYSKFMDASDAIRNIGVHVQNNLHGLQELQNSMEQINESNRQIEISLSTFRNPVGEKIRIQRLLVRLDALLKLPTTLQQQMDKRQYVMATKSYLSAATILAKHSEGFESLKSIELECHGLLQKLKFDLEHKLWHWSGRELSTITTTHDSSSVSSSTAAATTPDPPQNMKQIFEVAGTLYLLSQQGQNNKNNKDDDGNADDSSDQEQEEGIIADDDDDDDKNNKKSIQQHHYSSDDLQSMTVSASMRLLDRLLDTHLLQVQERKYGGGAGADGGGGLLLGSGLSSHHQSSSSIIGKDGTATNATATAAATSDAAAIMDGSFLIPQNVLQAILEGATLFHTNFEHRSSNESDAGGCDDEEEEETNNTTMYLLEFVTEAYTAFLSHVHSILLEESSSNNNNHGSPDSAEAADEDNNIDSSSSRRSNDMIMLDVDTSTKQQETNNREISGALQLLIQYVQDLAAGLAAIPTVADHDAVAKLVNQALELTESMIRRRVDQKFQDLKLSVVKDCLLSFAHKAAEERQRAVKAANEDEEDKNDDDDYGNNYVADLSQRIVPIATSTLSDCLQLVDDAIRSIFTEDSPSSSDEDVAKWKDAVHVSTYRFTAWLANAFEMLAGGESTDYRHLAEATPVIDSDGAANSGNDADSKGSGIEDFDNRADDNPSGFLDDMGQELSMNEDQLADLMDTARETLATDNGTIHSDLMLAIYELCRLSEVSVPENLEQSFTAHLGSGKKKSRIFASGGDSATGSETKHAEGDEDDEVRQRFQLAASRVLVMYTMSCGMEAADTFCRDLVDISIQSEGPEKPSSTVLAVLSIAKRTAIECSSILKGPKRGGPLPKWQVDSNDMVLSAGFAASRMMTGLQLDVERMFKERVTIYLHPSLMIESPSTNFVLFLFFKIVFRALFENARRNRFSSDGYRQLQADVAFLKHMVPHYINESYAEGGTNACTALTTLLDDAMDVVRNRCTDESCSAHDARMTVAKEAGDIVRLFLEGLEETPSLADRFIIGDDDGLVEV